MPDVSIIVPMYNESENIKDTYQQIADTFQTREEDWEILFVNDGSTDDTADVVRDLVAEDSRVRLLSYPKNQGRGYALRTGFAKAEGEFIVTTDADLSYAPKYILSLLDMLQTDQQTHFVLGSPYMPGGATEGVSAFRLFLSQFGNMMLRWSVNKDIYTWTGIFRAYRRKVIESIDLESNGKEIHLEILTRALSVGYQVREVPAVLATRRKGSSKFRFLGTISSHLKFILIERTISVFWIVGFIGIIISLMIGAYITYLRFEGTLNPERPLVTLMVILLLGSLQIISFGAIAFQIYVLRRELYRTQKQILLGQRKQNLPYND